MCAWPSSCAVPVQPAALELLTALAPVLARWGRWYMPLDVVLAGSGLEDAFLDRAVPTDIGGTTVPLIDLGDLIVAKVLAGRPKDLDDAGALWRLHGRSLDADRIRQTLRLIEEALGQSDLLPSFERIARPSRT